MYTRRRGRRPPRGRGRRSRPTSSPPPPTGRPTDRRRRRGGGNRRPTTTEDPVDDDDAAEDAGKAATVPRTAGDGGRCGRAADDPTTTNAARVTGCDDVRSAHEDDAPRTPDSRGATVRSAHEDDDGTTTGRRAAPYVLRGPSSARWWISRTKSRSTRGVTLRAIPIEIAGTEDGEAACRRWSLIGCGNVTGGR